MSNAASSSSLLSLLSSRKQLQDRYRWLIILAALWTIGFAVRGTHVFSNLSQNETAALEDSLTEPSQQVLTKELFTKETTISTITTNHNLNPIQHTLLAHPGGKQTEVVGLKRPSTFTTVNSTLDSVTGHLVSFDNSSSKSVKPPKSKIDVPSTAPFEKFKHLSPDETMQILTDLGSNDKYNDADIQCSQQKHREPELFWYDYTANSSTYPLKQSLYQQINSTKNATRRMLIVQSAGFGTYSQLLDLTAPVNKAYARRWGHTMLVIQGSLVVLGYEHRKKCTPPEHRSTHNKMQLLKFGLRLREYYDYLLILDADAMIYDWSYDISNLMPPTAMMAANRAVPKKGVKKRSTWKINAGVTLWNLHHPHTNQVAREWTKAAVGFLNGRNNWSGDQIFLYHVLKNNATLEKSVYAVSKEFHYNKATVIKHIKRLKVTYEIGQTGLDDRARIIEKFTKEICKTRDIEQACRSLDRTKYSAF